MLGTAQPELSKPNDSMPIDFLSNVKRILIIPFELWLIHQPIVINWFNYYAHISKLAFKT
jgi:hypothetical protein|tara:strand:- start:186 stop:365 length:180 start_codon:yes stop_codon:yes gene_type:complete